MDGRSVLPLPPGMVPSGSREDMRDLEKVENEVDGKKNILKEVAKALKPQETFYWFCGCVFCRAHWIARELCPREKERGRALVMLCSREGHLAKCCMPGAHLLRNAERRQPLQK